MMEELKKKVNAVYNWTVEDGKPQPPQQDLPQAVKDRADYFWEMAEDGMTFMGAMECIFADEKPNQLVSNIRKALSQIFDNLFTFFKNLEVEIEKIERRRTQNVRQRTFQISKHSTHNRLKKARIRNQKPRCSKWANCRNKQTYRNYRNQNCR